ncbi:MAG: restriction endonuclease [Desulfobacterales bacterium]|nr:restriction endonuclease [Desulfobacterales bacterium]
MTRESDSYERLVQELHEALLHSEGVENIAVCQNIKIQGRSRAAHQIDVYWEFRLAGVTYKTCIECKHFKKLVKKSHVAAFATVLDDIGNATGIFATTAGFQKGARLLAKEKGIRLILVNYILKTIHIASQFRMPLVTVTRLDFDRSHARQLLQAKGMQSYAFDTVGITGREVIVDSEGHPKCEFRKLFPSTDTGALTRAIEFEDAYLPTEIGNLRLRSAEYRVSVREFETEDLVTVDDVAKAIVEDVLENSALYLSDDGRIEPPST